jgi:regulator of replication initiation timing
MAAESEISTLKAHLSSLMDEKNALLDYIEENLDKNQSLSAKKQDSASKDTQGLTSRNQ